MTIAFDEGSVVGDIRRIELVIPDLGPMLSHDAVVPGLGLDLRPFVSSKASGEGRIAAIGLGHPSKRGVAPVESVGRGRITRRLRCGSTSRRSRSRRSLKHIVHGELLSLVVLFPGF